MFEWKAGDLNPEQELAILKPGNVFLVACPGSGKTRALTYKLAYELSRLQSRKHFVVAITYTNRAADEIHERVEKLGVDTEQLWIGTIHSFCLEWILKPYALYNDRLRKGFRVINTHDSEEILTQLCLPYKKERISYWDCGFYFTDQGYLLACSQRSKHQSLHKILAQYFATLERNLQIDFELILFFAHDLIVKNPTISLLLSKLFPFILVDEYQDTKQIQYFIISSILKAGQGSSLTFIVGDPNQAIFQSLGGYAIEPAEFSQMSGIQLNELALSKNYRSPQSIISYFSYFSVSPSTIVAASSNKDYPSLISLNRVVIRPELHHEIVRLIRYNINERNIPPHEICVLAPQWAHLGSMTRRLVAALPEYHFDGPGTVPFARDIENFWYKLSKLTLTRASPDMYIRRLRWAGEILEELKHAGLNLEHVSKKSLLRACNSIELSETNGLLYLKKFFEAVFAFLNVDFNSIAFLREHHKAFFDSSTARIAKLSKEGGEFIDNIEAFRRVFEQRSGITVSTIHGIKGDEYDCVIAYALLEGFVPHFSDLNGNISAKKLLYVIASRAKKNLHLISERNRTKQYDGSEYQISEVLAAYRYRYDEVP